MGKSAMPLTGVHIILIILGLDIIQTKNFLVETGDLKKDGAKEDKEEELTNTLSTDPANDYVMYMGKRIEYETETERRRDWRLKRMTGVICLKTELRHACMICMVPGH